MPSPISSVRHSHILSSYFWTICPEVKRLPAHSKNLTALGAFSILWAAIRNLIQKLLQFLYKSADMEAVTGPVVNLNGKR